MKIYLAGNFSEKEKIAKIAQRFIQEGHKITYDWTKHRPIKPYHEHPGLSQKYAINDAKGVTDCDIFVQKSCAEGGTGMFIELGIALSLNMKYGKPKIYVVGDFNTRSIFYFHPSVKRVRNFGMVLKEIKKLKK